MEPSVRFWWSLTLLILASSLFLGTRAIIDWRSENYLFTDGVPVKGYAYGDAAKVKGRPLSIVDPVILEFEFNGEKYTYNGYLINIGVNYESGAPISLRVDPRNPQHWTNRTVATSLGSKLIGATILLISGSITAVVSWLLARRHQNLWEQGESRTARVLEHTTSALAPRSVIVRCAIRSGKQEHAVEVFVPQSANPPSPGENIQVITEARGKQVIAAMNYYP